MKKRFGIGIAGLIIAPLSFALAPVTLSGPTPGVASSYSPGASSTVIYTITNNVPKSLEVTVNGISGPVSRTSTSNDCGNYLPKGPSTCNIGITIAPSQTDANTTINQTFSIDYQGRAPLTSDLNFTVGASSIYSYISDTGGFLWSCDLTSTGLFVTDSCNQLTPTNGTWMSPTGITIQTVNGTAYGYVGDGFGTGNVYQCGLTSTGSFSTCAIQPASGAPNWKAFDVAFATTNSTLYAYVTTEGTTVYQCSLNSEGSFNSCNGLSPTFIPPSPAWGGTIGITFSTFNGIQYAYVADAEATGLVTQCTIDNDGTFLTCTQTPSQSTGWDASAVAFITLNSGSYSYVADNHGDVWQCGVDSTGLFITNSCSTLSNIPGGNWSYPSGVTVQAVNGVSYVYVADGFGTGNVYQCGLNNNGSFSSCTMTPSAHTPAWQAWMVDFSS